VDSLRDMSNIVEVPGKPVAIDRFNLEYQEKFMNQAFESRYLQRNSGNRRGISILLWLAISAGWLVSVFSVIEEMCMVSACRDTAGFTIFGLNMGWFGIAYFSLLLMVLWLRKKVCGLEWVLSALVFSGVGAELRLLWIQKYVIGGWCPLCVTICCALFIAAVVLMTEKIKGTGSLHGSGKSFIQWIAFVVTMIGAGLSVAMFGVQALT
jgi:hypothetical protein